MTEEKAPRLAAAAPIEDDDNRPDPPVEGVAGAENFDDLIEQWERWKKTRRYYAPAPASGNLLGKLRGSTQPSRLPPDAPCRPNMAALHLAIIGQPRAGGGASRPGHRAAKDPPGPARYLDARVTARWAMWNNGTQP